MTCSAIAAVLKAPPDSLNRPHPRQVGGRIGRDQRASANKFGNAVDEGQQSSEAGWAMNLKGMSSVLVGGLVAAVLVALTPVASTTRTGGTSLT